ncbi:MAG: hypothetical protein PUC47_12205 [Oscillospiraceae bacterium]|nr:hypothetical protein [Oscillospiraceae bacterium]
MPERNPSQNPAMLSSEGRPAGNPACGCRCGEDEDCCAPRRCSSAHSSESALRKCCDANGCCCYYPVRCRNPFWPEFTHPRWLCCTELYDGRAESCHDCCAEEQGEKKI